MLSYASMTGNNQPADLLALFTALLALAFSRELAAVVAPYAVILLGALLGTGWGLKRRAPAGGRLGAWTFVVLMLGTALVFTMPAAVWLQQWLPGSYQWILAPLAATIAAVGEDWPNVGTWAAGMLRRKVEPGGGS